MSVTRHVYLKFNESFSDEEAVDDVVSRTAVLRDIVGVRDVRIGRPADAGARVWDLVLLVDFAAIADVQPYLDDPAHVGYYQDYLRPRLEVIKAWNFTF